MKELKIVQLLKTFSKEEVKLFKKFAASPYFNEGRDQLPLINELIKYYPGFDEKKFSKEKIFEVIYEGEKYDESAADKQLSRATGLARKFLLQRAFEKKSIVKSIAIAREYCERKLDAFYSEQVFQAESELQSSSVFEEDFFYNKLALETVRSSFQLANKDINQYRNFLHLRSDYALLDIIVKYIYSRQDFLLLQRELNVDFKKSLTGQASGVIDLEGLINLVKESGNEYSYVLEYKYCELKAMLDLNIDSYSLYKQVVYNNIAKLTWSEKYNALGALLSICIMGAQSGNASFEIETLIVSEKMLDENSYSYFENNFTNVIRYYNILQSFIKNGRNDLIDDLIEKFGKKLAVEHRESMINFSYMSKYFNEKNFLEALNYHAKIDYNHNLLKLNVRILLLKIYYELDYWDEAESLISSSLKYYSATTGVSRSNMERTLNLTKFVRRLIKLKEGRAKDKLDELYEEVKNINEINSKPWVLEKIKEAMTSVIR